MDKFIPKRAYFEPKALDYPLGQELYSKFQEMGVTIKQTSSHNRVSGIPGCTAAQSYREAKQTVVVGVRKITQFATCKPSAHYQLPLNTSCPSMCEYCYLATTLGKKPYLRIYVNIDEILNQVQHYIEERSPQVTIFEGAATSDPIPTEYFTGLLKKTIEFFGEQSLGRFRFVTKHTNIDSLLSAKHGGHTCFRFSINAESIINQYEHLTPSLLQRIHAAKKVAQAGYPLGFIIAPIFLFSGWQQEYEQLFKNLYKELNNTAATPLSFELITHRFTKRAKDNIVDIFPHTVLPMDETTRKFKFGQFGYGKYVYQKEDLNYIKEFMYNKVQEFFPQAVIKYFV